MRTTTGRPNSVSGSRSRALATAQSCGPDFYAALAAALGKLKAHLRRSHDRRQVHHGHRTPTSVAEATGTLSRAHDKEVTT